MFTLLAVLLVGIANGYEATPSSGCGTKAPVTPGETTMQSIKINDPISGSLTRVYNLHLPSSYDDNTPYTFIIDFHGYYMDGNSEEKDDHMSTISDSKGLIIVYPFGSNDSASNLYGWDSVGTATKTGTCDTNRKFWGEYECYTSCGSNCNPANTCYCSSCWNDTLFVEQMMDRFESTLCIDLAHIHATGISNGGMMDYQVAQSFSDIFASIVPVAGSSLLGHNKSPKSPISLMDWHGFNDNIIPANISNSYQYPKYIAPDGATWSADGFYYTPTDNNTALFAILNECEGSNALSHYPTKYDGQREIYCTRPYGNCKHGTDVVRCAGSWGHTWPLHQQDKSAYPNIVWNFISTHPKLNVTWKQE